MIRSYNVALFVQIKHFTGSIAIGVVEGTRVGDKETRRYRHR